MDVINDTFQATVRINSNPKLKYISKTQPNFFLILIIFSSIPHFFKNSLSVSGDMLYMDEPGLSLSSIFPSDFTDRSLCLSHFDTFGPQTQAARVQSDTFRFLVLSHRRTKT